MYNAHCIHSKLFQTIFITCDQNWEIRFFAMNYSVSCVESEIISFYMLSRTLNVIICSKKGYLYFCNTL